MDELFRFVALRPPMPVSDEIILDGASPLALRLAKAREAPDGRDAIDELARSFVRSEDFVQDASSLNLPLDKLAEALDHARFDCRPYPSDPGLDDLVKRTLGEPSRILRQIAEVHCRSHTIAGQPARDETLTSGGCTCGQCPWATEHRQRGPANCLRAGIRREIKKTLRSIACMDFSSAVPNSIIILLTNRTSLRINQPRRSSWRVPELSTMRWQH